jgi:hypothetical protein
MGHILMIGRKLHGKIVERVVAHVFESGELFLSEKRKRERERERESIKGLLLHSGGPRHN